ncbi:hypothetical protein N7G274_004475 [Stereocaulon virgatum]|uniref:Secreted protein n=1 Tax=Stereocaulon virgatum TaxID=373712 RepID=A0ABR4AB92_9LECA
MACSARCLYEPSQPRAFPSFALHTLVWSAVFSTHLPAVTTAWSCDHGLQIHSYSHNVTGLQRGFPTLDCALLIPSFASNYMAFHSHSQQVSFVSLTRIEPPLKQ